MNKTNLQAAEGLPLDWALSRDIECGDCCKKGRKGGSFTVRLRWSGATFRSLGEAIETESAAGRMMMQMLGCFAQFEREIIVERINRGLAHARANGKIGGGRYKLSPDDQREAIRLIQVDKKSQGQVAHVYKVDRSTISRMMTEVRLKQDLKGGVL